MATERNEQDASAYENELLDALGRIGREERELRAREERQDFALSDITRERLVGRALAELGANTKATKAGTSDERASHALSRREATVRSVRSRAPLVVGALALAAAVALWVGTRNEGLPPYQLSVQGGTSDWRGPALETPDRLDVRADGSLELLLRPERPVTRPIQARAFATRDGVERELPVDMSSQGVARVKGRVDVLFGPDAGVGPWTIAIVVGDAGRVPSSLGEAKRRDDLRLVEKTVVVTK
ncbi:MAG TPA: hypothetical protein VM580_34185 [Labilithrix sp.]|nr:hypothetical protein [Labilithrix sp.]